MLANRTLLQRKYTRVVKEFANIAGLPLRSAMDFFYKSETYREINKGICDLHCMSDGYLAEELLFEYKESVSGTII